MLTVIFFYSVSKTVTLACSPLLIYLTVNKVKANTLTCYDYI